MKQTTKLGILAIALLVVTSLLIVNVSALRVTLDSPQVSFTNKSVGDIVNYKIAVQNKNPYPVQVKIMAPSDLIVKFDGETNFMLNPNEKKEIPYEITITSGGDYTKQIKVEYIGNEESFAVYQQLLFNVEKESPKQFILWGLIIVVVIAIVIWLIRSSRKKSK